MIVLVTNSRSIRAVDLLLCGHHYRESQPTITAAHGTIEVLPERSADAVAALFTRAAVA